MWHPGLSRQQSCDIERIQRRVLRIIYPDTSYVQALSMSGLEPLSNRREKIARELFSKIKMEGHVLNYLLNKRETNVNIREQHRYDFCIPNCRTDRCRRDFINYCLFKRF